MTDYILTFSLSERGDEINITERFVDWYRARQEGPKRAGHDTWLYSPGIGFKLTNDEDGVALTAQGFDESRLYQILASFFAYVGSARGYAAIAPANPGASVGVVLLSNDPDVTPDPLGSESRGMMRRYQASAILAGANLFGSIHDDMFGLNAAVAEEQPEDSEVESETRNLGVGAWIFADLNAPADATGVEETAFLIGGAGTSPGQVLEQVLNIPEITVYADDYFTYEDPANRARAAAQPFPTDAGLFTEMRLELPPGPTLEQILLLIAARVQAAGYNDLYLIRAYDDAESLVRVAPLHPDGSLGPIRVLKRKF